MPELPEVETVMRGLRPRLEGRRIERVLVNRADMRWPFPPGLGQALTGARVTGLARRAKYILIRTDRDATLMLHLGMSGRVNTARADPDPPVAHEHLVLWTEEGWRLALVDPRRFGSVDLMPTADEAAHRLLAPLGPEPLGDGFDAKTFAAAITGRRTSIKAALLDQAVVAGLGNIYVCEALFAAGISPRRIAGSIPGARAVRLVPAIKATLLEAIAAGGSSLRDYVQPDGELGYFQHAWRVYGREGEPCPRCPGAPQCPGVSRIVQSARSTFYCPRTQR